VCMSAAGITDVRTRTPGGVMLNRVMRPGWDAADAAHVPLSRHADSSAACPAKGRHTWSLRDTRPVLRPSLARRLKVRKEGCHDQRHGHHGN
jgi:hypothetical protein